MSILLLNIKSQDKMVQTKSYSITLHIVNLYNCISHVLRKEKDQRRGKFLTWTKCIVLDKAELR